METRLGSEKLEILLKQTLEVARRRKFLNPSDLDQVNVDTTVQPKAIAFPTDTRLYYKIIRILGRLAKKAGLEVRQSYVRKSKQLLIMQNRYAHARQYKRSRMCEKKLKTIMGRVTRDITRKLNFCGSEVLRGSSFNLVVLYALSSYRLNLTPSTRLLFSGFRLAKTPELLLYCLLLCY